MRWQKVTQLIWINLGLVLIVLSPTRHNPDYSGDC